MLLAPELGSVARADCAVVDLVVAPGPGRAKVIHLRPCSVQAQLYKYIAFVLLQFSAPFFAKVNKYIPSNLQNYQSNRLYLSSYLLTCTSALSKKNRKEKREQIHKQGLSPASLSDTAVSAYLIQVRSQQVLLGLVFSSPPLPFLPSLSLSPSSGTFKMVVGKAIVALASGHLIATAVSASGGIDGLVNGPREFSSSASGAQLSSQNPEVSPISLESSDLTSRESQLASEPSSSQRWVGSKATSADNARLGRLTTELYRGQPRWPRVRTAYAVDCSMETPLLAVHGVESVERCAKAWASLRPVQLAHREEYSEDGKRVRVYMSTEVRLLSRTFLIPSRVELDLDEEGRVERHVESWHGYDLVEALHPVRMVNGWLMENFLAWKSH